MSARPPGPSFASALIACAGVILAALPPVAGASAWRSPVPGPVTRAFLLGPDPFAPGQHRGADLAASRGARVRAACSGVVTFAGRVPRGPTVSVRCGRLVATHQHLEGVRVRRGERVRAGASIARVGNSGRPRPHVHLSARMAATGRYVDPMVLIAATDGLGPAPPPAVPRRPFRRPPAPAVTPLRLAPEAAPQGSPLPWTAGAGLLLLAPAIGVGGLVRRRRATVRAGLRPGEVVRAPR